MNGRLLLGAGLAVSLSGCGGSGNTHYTYGKSIDCFKDIGKTQVMGRSNDALRISADGGKTYDVLFLPNGSQAKSYVKKLKVPATGVLETKGNAIVYGHQIGTGPAVSKDEVKEVEKCLA